MFEDSLMESGNRIKAKSKYWSILTFLLNCGAVIALIIWPLLHPEALPKQIMAELMVAPPAPPPPPPRAPAPKVQTRPEMLTELVQAPSRIPKEGRPVQGVAMPPSIGVGIPGAGTLDSISSVIGSIGTGPAVTVRQAPRKTLSISSGVMAGNLIQKDYAPVPRHSQDNPHPGNRSAAGNDLQSRLDPEPQGHQRSCDAAASSSGCCSYLAVQTLSSQRRARRGGNYGQRSVHPWPMTLRGSAHHAFLNSSFRCKLR